MKTTSNSDLISVLEDDGVSKAELVKATAITSTTLAVSEASNPKPLTAAPATVAALAKSD